ncbi:MORC family CW-type zinc finger protein 3a isoform X2 [Antennarius striatus]|uniref:MORC family CW-type zinc finger protein 3a isoform X2 n=1 Tax=Antennarius striatus TaxID=241820 RepID=UPI0035B2960F
MAAEVRRGVPVSTLCPKFLHSNSTSHTWPFSAIAELIDNAYDPDVNAKQFWIDKTMVKGQECLSFMDNGNGLDHETMHKMLSFGYSDKIALDGLEPIGIYGNGFKSGSMRLGKDAIVFSKSTKALCVGMLSQTYLEMIHAQQIIVPIVCFEQERPNKLRVREEHKASLQDILCYSPFKTQEELLVEIDAITSSWSTGTTGTRIIIWNLRRTSAGTTEFDFEKDRYDIRIPSDVYDTINNSSQGHVVTSYTPESVHSLRAYSSILYLKPRMQIIIRGQKVKSQLIAKSLAYIRKDHYKPIFLNKRIPIIFGYNTKSKDQYGIMMYHKNRLIKAYERAGCQLKANNKGVGVIGVIECNFLDPTHNKQSFMETDKYRKTMISLGIKLEEYWMEIHHKRIRENPNSVPVEDAIKRPDQNWVQCDECLKWRKLPDGINCSKLPDKWYCRLNPDPQFRNCLVGEEPEDSDDDQPSYRKTYKQQEREDKKIKEKKRQKDEEERRQRVADLTRQNLALKQQQENLEQQLRQKPTYTPSTPTTSRSRINAQTAARPESSTISQAASSPSGLPVISHVYSLSQSPQRGKRVQPSPQRTPKRPKVNGFHVESADVVAYVNMSPQNSPSVAAEDTNDINDSDDTDEDIFILETASTPKPQKPSVNLIKVKTESDEDAVQDVTIEKNVAGPSTSSASVSASPFKTSLVEMASTTTQTEVRKIKTEKNPNETEGTGTPQKSSDLEDVSFEEHVIKQESGDDPGKMPDPLDGQDNAGPSCADLSNKDSPLHFSNMMEIQTQQDHLIELMHASAQERDSYKEQVDELTSQLKDAQRSLQKLSQIGVKKECFHQASQTEETEEDNDYKTLFEKAKVKIDALIKEKQALLVTTQTQSISTKVEGRDIDEIALQVDQLIRQVDQRNKERDELRLQLDSLEEERANLAAQCEELRMRLQQNENAQKGSTAAHRTTDSPSEKESLSRSLIELRHNIGRLLISYVPALDLGQVNYECNVIDEILEQVLSSTQLNTVKSDVHGDKKVNT